MRAATRIVVVSAAAAWVLLLLALLTVGLHHEVRLGSAAWYGVVAAVATALAVVEVRKDRRRQRE